MITTEIRKIEDPILRLVAFALEREAIRLRRAAGQTKPWTNDPILRAYRFCNVRREDDKVTIWIREHWRAPHADDPDLWFAMAVARLVNWPDTLAKLGYPVPWDEQRFLDIMSGFAKGEKVYGGAYMLPAGERGVAKPVHQAQTLFNPMWCARERLRPKARDTLNSYHILLGQFHGMGSFLTAQVIADLKYVNPLREASDWHTFAASGPGSRRGLNRVLGRKVDVPWSEDGWRLALKRLQVQFNERWEGELLHGQDVQNCLCEFDKYERTRLGEGRPRARYNGGGS